MLKNYDVEIRELLISTEYWLCLYANTNWILKWSAETVFDIVDPNLDIWVRYLENEDGTLDSGSGNKKKFTSFANFLKSPDKVAKGAIHLAGKFVTLGYYDVD